MIKVDYLGYVLVSLLLQSDTWYATYMKGYEAIAGEGHSPEAAVADAQRQIKLA